MFVKRVNGEIRGSFSQPQPHDPDVTWEADDTPDMIAFGELMRASVARVDDRIEKLSAALVQKGVLTKAEADIAVPAEEVKG